MLCYYVITRTFSSALCYIETSLIRGLATPCTYFLHLSLSSVILTDSGWRRGIVVSGVRCMNEVNARRARLVPGWVTVFGRVYHLGM